MGKGFTEPHTQYNDEKVISPEFFEKNSYTYESWLKEVAKIAALAEGIKNGGEFYFRVIEDDE